MKTRRTVRLAFCTDHIASSLARTTSALIESMRLHEQGQCNGQTSALIGIASQQLEVRVLLVRSHPESVRACVFLARLLRESVCLCVRQKDNQRILL